MAFAIKSFLLLTIATGICAQDTRGQHYAIEVLKMNVVYIGVPNPINIVVQGHACKDIVVMTDNGKLEMTGNCGYNFWPTDIGEATIKIVSKARNRLVGERQFRVKHLPSPTSRIAGKNSGRISANVLRVQLGITTFLDDLDISYEITQYFLTLIGTNGTCITFGPTHTAYFTEQMKSALQNVKSGDRIVVTGIRAALPPSKDELIVRPIDIVVE